eukprot:scaffold2926_cov110-Isochrysis_galbana.AAC.9
MAAWPDGLMALLDDGATPLRELLIVDKLNVSLDHLGPGGYGPLALLVRLNLDLLGGGKRDGRPGRDRAQPWRCGAGVTTLSRKLGAVD